MKVRHIAALAALLFSQLSFAGDQSCSDASLAATLAGIRVVCSGDPDFNWPETLKSGTRDELREALKQCYFSGIYHSVVGWALHNSPRAEVQGVARELIYKGWHLISGQVVQTEEDAQALISGWAAQEVPMSASYLAELDANFLQRLEPGLAGSLKLAGEASSKLCLFQGSLKQCANAVNELLDLMKPYTASGTGALVSLKPLLQRFLGGPFERMVAARIAQRIYRRSNESPSGVHFFGDVEEIYRTALIEKGASVSQARKEAVERTWDFVALYATRGMSWLILSELVPRESKITLLILTEVGRLVTKTDARWVSAGHPYSYPPELKMDCFHARPYHFWMSAYFAHYLNTVRDLPRWTSFSAAYLPGLLYELGSTTWGRDPMKPFLVKYDDGYNQSIRQNLVLKKMGAKWGSESHEKLWKPTRFWDFANLFDAQVQSGQAVHLSLDEIRGLKQNPVQWYFWFDELFNPFHDFMEYYSFDRRRAHCDIPSGVPGCR